RTLSCPIGAGRAGAKLASSAAPICLGFSWYETKPQPLPTATSASRPRLTWPARRSRRGSAAAGKYARSVTSSRATAPSTATRGSRTWTGRSEARLMTTHAIRSAPSITCRASRRPPASPCASTSNVSPKIRDWSRPGRPSSTTDTTQAALERPVAPATWATPTTASVDAIRRTASFPMNSRYRASTLADAPQKRLDLADLVDLGRRGQRLLRLLAILLGDERVGVADRVAGLAVAAAERKRLRTLGAVGVVDARPVDRERHLVGAADRPLDDEVDAGDRVDVGALRALRLLLDAEVRDDRALGRRRRAGVVLARVGGPAPGAGPVVGAGPGRGAGRAADEGAVAVVTTAATLGVVVLGAAGAGQGENARGDEHGDASGGTAGRHGWLLVERSCVLECTEDRGGATPVFVPPSLGSASK